MRILLCRLWLHYGAILAGRTALEVLGLRRDNRLFMDAGMEPMPSHATPEPHRYWQL